VNIRVRTILAFKDILGSRELEMDMPEGTTVNDLLRELMRRYGEKLTKALWDVHSNAPARYVRVMVNGQDIYFIDNLATVLHEGDELLLVPPVGGGSGLAATSRKWSASSHSRRQ
jgi:molybdopterin synthase sulfur carrier subunit